MNVGIGTAAEQFPVKEYINGIFVAVRIMQDEGGGEDAVPSVPRWNTSCQVEGTPERLCQQVSMQSLKTVT
jgi:hypothetical protein